MPSPDHSSAIARVNCAIPPLEAPYANPPGNALVDCSEAKFTILPQPLSFITEIAACDKKNGADKLISKVLSHPSEVTSSAVCLGFKPAACTKISGIPTSLDASDKRLFILSR